jgi:hypothetical protein
LPHRSARKAWSRLALALLCLALAAPGVAIAAPATPTIAVAPAPLTPFSSSGCVAAPNTSCYRASGKADPGVKITLTVNAAGQPDKVVKGSTFSAEVTDPGSGTTAGDWVLSPNVTELGSHDGTTSTLVFTVVATDAGGVSSAPASVSVVKNSTTAGDDTGPFLTSRNAPPQNWCHIGITCPPPPPQTCPIGNPNLTKPEDILKWGCSGQSSFTGFVQDHVSGDRNLVSEIKDIVITIVQGANPDPYFQFHSVYRTGTRADYGVTVNISDFAPGDYSWYVEAFDAANNGSNVVFGSFTVRNT